MGGQPEIKTVPAKCLGGKSEAVEKTVLPIQENARSALPGEAPGVQGPHIKIGRGHTHLPPPAWSNSAHSSAQHLDLAHSLNHGHQSITDSPNHAAAQAKREAREPPDQVSPERDDLRLLPAGPTWMGLAALRRNHGHSSCDPSRSFRLLRQAVSRSSLAES